jgi:hypothetical protein
MFANPSGPIATEKKSRSARVPLAQRSPRLQIGPKCITWSLTCEMVKTGSRESAFSDWANIVFQCRFVLFGSPASFVW